MKILFTNPPWIIKDGFKARFGVRAGSRWPFTAIRSPFVRPYIPYPSFMGYAVSYLQSQGIEAVFYDAIALEHNYRVFYKNVDNLKPDIVIQETSTPSFDIDLEIARKLHEKYEVCLAGPHATAFAQDLIKLPFVDYVLKGEYEYSSLEMARTRRKGAYESQRVVNLDDLPYPYRDKAIVGRYNEPCCKKKLAYPQLWVYAGRGCAFQCNFCLWVHTLYNKRFTLRAPEKVLAEIEELISQYNFKYIMFDDDCWNLGGDERLMKLADGLKKIGLPWSILCRMDTSSKEMFKYFVDRGCVGLRLGVESLSQRLLDKTNKNLRVEEIVDKINFLKGLNISLYLCFMHYLPGETEEDRQVQQKKIKDIGIKSQDPPCIPFPGTPYYQEMRASGIDLEKIAAWKEFDGGNIGKNLIRAVKEYSQKSKNSCL